MKELLRTNDAVLLSYVEALLTEAGIGHAILDANMSIIEGSIGVLPRRIIVHPDDWTEACRLLDDAEIENGQS